MDYAAVVPRERQANLKYRLELRNRCRTDAKLRSAVTKACKEDFVYFLNAFVWLYEPRIRLDASGNKLPREIPFITWSHQEPIARELQKSIGTADIVVEKSRGEGMSWMGVMLALHNWLFEDMIAIGFVSDTEDKADNPDDPNSLMWKVDYAMSKLPLWMVGKKDADWTRKLSDHTLKNHRNGSTIAAFAATGDVARGGRSTWFLLDEFAASGWQKGKKDSQALASTQHVTDSRLFVSTPNGTDGEFYKIVTEPSNVVKLVLDWKDNQTRNRGLYMLKDGVPVAVDPINNPLPADYNPPTQKVLELFERLRHKGYKLEDKLRSPWYDRECDRPGATPQKIAQELDRDYGGSMHKIFGDDFFVAAKATIRDPVKRGRMAYNKETLDPDFDAVDNGPMQLWMPLDAHSRPPRHKYVLGADVSLGVGGSYTSNSTLVGIDLVTGEQVLEFAINTMSPADFADLCIATAKWMHDAYLSWEANGPGRAFTRRVMERGYGDIYYRTQLWEGSGTRKERKPGWWTDEDTKTAMLSELSVQVKSGKFVVRSKRLMEECGQYIVQNGKIVHLQSSQTTDDAAKGKAHGDRVIGAGVAVMAGRERPVEKEERMGGEAAVGATELPPLGTMARRMQEATQKEKDDDFWQEPIHVGSRWRL